MPTNGSYAVRCRAPFDPAADAAMCYVKSSTGGGGAASEIWGMGGTAGDESKRHQATEDEEYLRKRREALELMQKLRAQGVECELSEDLTVVRKRPPN